jgi:hypothetical protein
MDQKEVNLEEYVDQHRWLLNNGLVTEEVKNQLFFCGSIAHKDIAAVEVKIEAEKKLVEYTIYVDQSLLDKIKKYEVLSKSDSLFSLWRFKRLLKKEGSLDFQAVLDSFVKDFCGPKWQTRVNTVNFNSYVEEQAQELGEASETDGRNQQSDQLPD